MKSIFILLLLACFTFAQAPLPSSSPVTALSLLEKLLAEYKSPARPPPTIFYGGRDTPDTILLRELEDQQLVVKQRIALVQEIEIFIRNEKLKIETAGRQRNITPQIP